MDEGFVITRVLSVDILALVLGAYCYRSAAKLSTVCHAFRDAVRRVQFWTRGIRVELRTIFSSRGIGSAAMMARIVRDFDPYAGNGVSIRDACSWIFNDGLIRTHETGKRHVMIGLRRGICFLWQVANDRFMILTGPFDFWYGEIPGQTYQVTRVMENGFPVNRVREYIAK